MGISRRRKTREGQKRKRRWPSTPRGWIRRWRRSLGVIEETALNLWEDREIYRTYRRIVSDNPSVHKPNEFLDFIERIYVTHTLITLRKFDDTDLRSHSLYNFIEEILDNNNQITKEWFLSTWPRSLRKRGETRFRTDWGRGIHPSKTRLRHDRRLLTNSCRKIRIIVNSYIAHTTRRGQPTVLHYQQIDQTFDTIWQLVGRYHMLLFRGKLCATSMSNWTGVFDIAWNPRGVGKGGR